MFNENLLTFGIHGTDKHAGSLTGLLEQLLIFLESIDNKSPEQVFALIFPGVSAMENIHPLLVHFPIAFISFFVLVDIIACIFRKPSWRNLASGLLYFGTLTAAFTVYAGFEAAKTVAHDDVVHEVIERHEHLAISVLILASLLSLWRLLSGSNIKNGANFFFLLLALILAGLVSLTADLGGLLVYHHGVAVLPAAMNASNGDQTEHSHDHDHEHSH